MKKFKILAIFLCVMVASIAWTQAETNKDKSISKQIEELKNEVEILKKRIKTLEKKLQLFTHMNVEIPMIFPKLQKIPEGWQKCEYNGIEYYIIPLKTDYKNTNQKKK